MGNQTTSMCSLERHFLLWCSESDNHFHLRAFPHGSMFHLKCNLHTWPKMPLLVLLSRAQRTWYVQKYVKNTTGEYKTKINKGTQTKKWAWFTHTVLITYLWILFPYLFLLSGSELCPLFSPNRVAPIKGRHQPSCREKDSFCFSLHDI